MLTFNTIAAPLLLILCAHSCKEKAREMLLSRVLPDGGLQEGCAHLHQPVLAAVMNGNTAGLEYLLDSAGLDLRLPPCVEYIQVSGRAGGAGMCEEC